MRASLPFRVLGDRVLGTGQNFGTPSLTLPRFAREGIREGGVGTNSDLQDVGSTESCLEHDRADLHADASDYPLSPIPYPLQNFP